MTGGALESSAIFDANHVKAFVHMTGDSNPIHTSRAAAEAQGFEDCIVPGMLCASLFPAIIGSAFPGALYMTQDLKFRHPALVGEPLLARVTLTAKSVHLHLQHNSMSCRRASRRQGPFWF
ncbi:g2077 [Coccomyxa viridis]|uniref:G2077 protein n=1 Tax=Coccomyxa viridis TaxID=1274662 RepID=A0ABP1FRH0_9CHLO